MKIGLTLGKFAPLHKGHEYLIAESYRQLDGGPLYVIMYDDKYYREIPLLTRADWIRKNPAFKGMDIRVVIGYNSPNDCGDSEEIQRIQENYILNTLGFASKGITHFFSSESYGEHIAKALNCIDVRIDMSRANVPVSGTMIRWKTAEHRKYLSPCVYKDLIQVVTFMGGPGAGKSTLVEEFAKRANIPFCPEYGREYWEKFNVDRRLTPEQMEEICEGHLEREDEQIMKAERVCLIDTNPITTYLFSMYYHGVPTERTRKFAEECISRYKLFIVCADDFAFNETEDRSGEGNRRLLQNMTMDYLDYNRVQYFMANGSLENRINTLWKLIDVYPHRAKEYVEPAITKHWLDKQNP